MKIPPHSSRCYTTLWYFWQLSDSHLPVVGHFALP